MRMTPVYLQNALRIYIPIKYAYNDHFRYRACSVVNDSEIELPILKCSDADGKLFVVVMPYRMETSEIRVFERHTHRQVISFPLSEAIRNEKINRRVFKDDSLLSLCESIDCQNPLLRGQYDMNLDDCFETFDGDVVWRIAVDWRGTYRSKPRFKLFYSNRRVMDADVHEFEYQEGLVRESVKVNRTIATFRIPSTMSDFCLFAFDPQREVTPNFYPMEEAAAAPVIEERTTFMQSVDDQQETYAKWVNAHLAALAEYEAESDAAGESVLHVVVWAQGHAHADIVQSLESLEQQKNATWRATVLTSDEIAAIQKSERVNTIRVNSAKEVSEAVRSIAEDAGAKHICIIEAGDTFAQGALIKITEAVANRQSVIVFDEDAVDENGSHSQPRFKSKLNKQLVYTENWLGYGAAFPAKLVTETTSTDNASSPSLIAYALALAAIQEQLPFEHIPAVLLHTSLSPWGERRANNGAFLPEEIDVAKALLSGHFAALGTQTVVEDGFLSGTLRISLGQNANPGKVSIIIPTMDHGDMLERCVSSILEKATYDDIEIILVENNSKKAETFALYDRLQKENPGIVKVVTWDGPFNYSAIINFGVAASTGKFLLLLNNDTEVIVPGFIEEMLALATIPEVGVVGAKLYFKDMLVQHAGMLIGPYDGISHVNQNFSDIRPGYQNRALTTSSFSSVTGACQMARREVFDEVGGYDDTFVVGFNDADFCLKVRAAGYDVVFTPYAELYHFEFVSRGRETIDDEKQKRWENERDAFFKKWEGTLKDGDPLTNPNLDKDNWYYALPEA